MATSEIAHSRPPTDDRMAPPNLATPTEDLVTVIFGACLIIGAMTDGWAHSNILSDVQAEGFFTPWHGLLYSGFAASAAWTFWLAYRRRDRYPRWWMDAWPAGYKLGALGVMIFLVAGFLDMVWHTVFGIEVSIDALLSPSHLLLTTGATLLLTSPARSWWASGSESRRAFTGAVGLALGTTSVAVFTSYASFFDHPDAIRPYEADIDSFGQLVASRGVASYLITTTVLVVPLLMAYRRRATFGVGTALVTWVSMFTVATNEAARPFLAGALAAIAAAALADLLLVRLDRARGQEAPLRLPIAGAIFAALVTAAHLIALHLDSRILWPVELWSGAVVISALAAGLLGGLASRPASWVKG